MRTNLTGTVSEKHEIALEALGQPRNVEIMRAVFHNPERLRLGRTSTAITQEAAQRVAEIAAILYNQRPSWLAACHAKLDAAVAAAYGWPADLSEEMIIEQLLELNHALAATAEKI